MEGMKYKQCCQCGSVKFFVICVVCDKNFCSQECLEKWHEDYFKTSKKDLNIGYYWIQVLIFGKTQIGIGYWSGERWNGLFKQSHMMERIGEVEVLEGPLVRE